MLPCTCTGGLSLPGGKADVLLGSSGLPACPQWGARGQAVTSRSRGAAPVGVFTELSAAEMDAGRLEKCSPPTSDSTWCQGCAVHSSAEVNTAVGLCAVWHAAPRLGAWIQDRLDLCIFLTKPAPVTPVWCAALSMCMHDGPVWLPATPLPLS